MNGPFCPSCGASVEGVRFCTSCGTPVTPAASSTPESPYEYLFADGPRTPPPGHAPDPQVQQEPYDPPLYTPAPYQPDVPAPHPSEYPTVERQAVRAAPYQQPYQQQHQRRSFGWQWVIAAAVLLLAVVGGGIALTIGHSGNDTASPPRPQTPPLPSQAPSKAPSRPAPSGTASTTSSPRPAAARVATRVRGLLAQEVAAHRRDNAAVGALLTCANVAPNRSTVTAFAGQRTQLASELSAVGPSGNARLDGVTKRLLATWRSLAPVDARYAAWAAGVHGSHAKCHASGAPSTSAASKASRRALAADWVALLRANPQWDVPQVPGLTRGGLSYLLL